MGDLMMPGWNVRTFSSWPVGRASEVHADGRARIVGTSVQNPSYVIEKRDEQQELGRTVSPRVDEEID